MNRLSRLMLFLGAFLWALGLVSPASASSFVDKLTGPSTNPTKDAMAQVRGNYLENKGQWNNQALFVTQSGGLDFWVTRTGFVLDSFKITDGKEQASFLKEESGARPRQMFREGQVVRFDLVGAKGKVEASGSNPIDTKIDFVGIGRPTHTGIHSYDETLVSNILPGVDARYYKQDGKPRYDLIVNPGSKATQIAFDIVGANDVQVFEDGHVGILTNSGWLHQNELLAYQGEGANRTQVASKFEVTETKGGYRLNLVVADFDRTRPLVIDPVVYGTHFGGSTSSDPDNVPSLDEVWHVASDNATRAYFTGFTTNIDFPITAGPYGVTPVQTEAFVAAFEGDDYDVIYVAFVGGATNDKGRFVQVDQYGNVWLAVATQNPAFNGGIDQVLRLQAGNPAPTSGSFRLTYASQVVTLPFNATANDVQTALNALTTIPSGGFVVTGGPLPGTNIRIRAFDPNATALTVQNQAAPYRVLPTTNASTQFIDADTTNWGFTPTGGTFKLTVQGVGTTGNIVFNATATNIQNALRGLPGFLSPPRSSVVANPVTPTTLPTGRFQVDFITAAAAPEVRAPMTVDNTLLTTSNYQLAASAGAADAAVVIRFTKDAFGLVPANFRTFSGVATLPAEYNAFYDRSISGFSVRPTTTSSGPVEILLCGNAQTMGDITATPPANASRGYYMTLNFTTGTGIQINQAKSGYVGGSAFTQVHHGLMDSDGSIILTGEVEVQTPTGFGNATLGPTSTVFATTTGGWANSNLLRSRDAFLRKLNPDGTTMFSGVIGGSNEDRADQIALDSLGNIYMVARTRSFNYPRTLSAFDQTPQNKVVVTKINSSGTQIVFSTGLKARVVYQPTVNEVVGAPPAPTRFDNYLDPYAIAVDQRQNIYVGGSCVRGQTETTIPMTLTPAAPFIAGQIAALDTTLAAGTQDAFLTVLNPTATGLLFSTLMGSEDSLEWVNTVVCDRAGAAWVGGGEALARIPTAPWGLPNAFLSPLAFKFSADGYDGYLVKFKLIQPILDTITVTPQDVAGGLGSTALVQVTLRSPAPNGGATVTLRLSNPTVARFNTENGPTNLRITIPQGSVSFTTPVTVATKLVAAPTSVDIRAELDGDAKTARLNVRPWMESFTLGTNAIPGGEIVNATITISQAAPAGGIPVTMDADSTLVTLPANLTIPAGQTSITFGIPTAGVDVVTDVNITATIGGVGVTQPLQLLPPIVESLTIAPDRVSGGEVTTGFIRIQGLAGPNTIVSLSQTGTTSVTIPATVQIPQGDDEVEFSIQTNFVSTNSSVVITALLNGSTATDTLFVDNTQIVNVVLNPTTITAGGIVNGQVNLTRPAGLTGLRIPLTNSNPGAGDIINGDPNDPLATDVVVVPPGATAGNFQIQTKPVASPQILTVTTNKPGYAVASANLTINPLVVSFTFSVSPTIMTGGQNATGTIALAAAAPIDLTFNLSDTSSNLSMPASITVPAGQTSITFPITSQVVAAIDDVTLTASLFSSSRTATIRLLPPGVSSFTLTPNVVPWGTSSTGRIVLNQPAPAGGTLVNITNNNPLFVTHVSSIVIPAGQTEGTFTINTLQVTRNISVTMTATLPARAQSYTALLTITTHP